MREKNSTTIIEAEVYARFEYHTHIEVEVPDQAAEEEIRRALDDAAQLAVEENCQTSNGLQPEIFVTRLDEEGPAKEQNEQDTTDKPASSYPVQRLQRAPACLFPVKNEVTGNTVWFEVAPSAYGAYITIHRHQPPIQDASQLFPETAMATVHVDYYVDADGKGQEQVKVQLWDEQAGPYGDPGWNIPDDYTSSRDASIILVGDVQRWQPPESAGESEK
jgi:hypothetical protein